MGSDLSTFHVHTSPCKGAQTHSVAVADLAALVWENEDLVADLPVVPNIVPCIDRCFFKPIETHTLASEFASFDPSFYELPTSITPRNSTVLLLKVAIEFVDLLFASSQPRKSS